MYVEARVASQPPMNHRGLMGAVIVHDQMDLKFLGHLFIDGVEELAKFHRPMPSVKLSDHFAAFGLQGSKQRSDPVSSVVMGAPLHLTGTHRQKRLRAIQSLDLGLLV